MIKNHLPKPSILWISLLCFFTIIYFYNLDSWLMHDDEGTDLYEVWQLQEGQQPGIDYIAEQQPLFLLVGSQVIKWVGRNPIHLRLLAVIQVLAGAFILAMSIRHIEGDLTAILTLILILTSGLILEQARLFRPDPMMLAWEMIGLASMLLAINQNKHLWWGVAGFCYGIAVLWKPFGLLPVFGLILYFVCWLWRERSAWKSIVKAGFVFSIPFLLISFGCSLLLYNRTGFYYAEAFSYHAAMEAGVNFFLRFGRNLLVFLLFFWFGLIYLFLVPLWHINRRQPWQHPKIITLLLTQLISSFIFAFVTRPIHVRYFLYLIPVLALLLAFQIKRFLNVIEKEHAHAGSWEIPIIICIFIIAIVLSQPNMLHYITRQETDTLALADFVASQTAPGTAVLSDYATINFLANRPSVYEASIVAGGQIQSGAVTGKRLIRSIEERDVQMVLIHVEGGDPFPHQLVKLIDYDDFRSYITENFELLTVFDRNGQLIEVYKRPLPHEP